MPRRDEFEHGRVGIREEHFKVRHWSEVLVDALQSQD